MTARVFVGYSSSSFLPFLYPPRGSNNITETSYHGQYTLSPCESWCLCNSVMEAVAVVSGGRTVVVVAFVSDDELKI